MKTRMCRCAALLCALLLALHGGASAQSLETPQTKPVKVRSVSVSPKKKTLKVGETLQLSAIVKPADAPRQLTYKSSNKKVASVDAEGLVSAHKRGSATITVRAQNGRKAKCKITVKQPVVSLKLGKSTLALPMGKSKKIGCKVSPSSANDKRVSWKSSAAKVATVSQAGVVKAKHPGSCTITATSKDGSVQSRCTVTVSQSKALIEKFGDMVDGDYSAMEREDLSVAVPNQPSKIFVPDVTMQRLRSLFPYGHAYRGNVVDGTGATMGEYDGFTAEGNWAFYPKELFGANADTVAYTSDYLAFVPSGYTPAQFTNRAIHCGDSMQTVVDTYGVPHMRGAYASPEASTQNRQWEVLIYLVWVEDSWGELSFEFNPDTKSLQRFTIQAAQG